MRPVVPPLRGGASARWPALCLQGAPDLLMSFLLACIGAAPSDRERTFAVEVSQSWREAPPRRLAGLLFQVPGGLRQVKVVLPEPAGRSEKLPTVEDLLGVCHASYAVARTVWSERLRQ